MNHHDVFSKYPEVDCQGTGNHIFDFLGVATDVSFKKAWDKFAIRQNSVYRAPLPPLNEHYFDWIALLKSVAGASGVFRMMELGAGWAPWLVRGSAAAKHHRNIQEVELLGVEADPRHYSWAMQHFLDNDLLPSQHHLIHGAVAPEASVLKFPKIDNPNEDYGASTRQVYGDREYIEVAGYTLDDLISRLSGPVDFLHSDIQGAEYDVFPQNMHLLESNIKNIMIGTHLSTEKHNYLRALFLDSGWELKLDFPRNEESQTKFGPVKFGDGFLLFENKHSL